MANTALNRSTVLLLTNKSGGDLTQGAVVIVDSANASAFTTNTAGAYVAGTVGVILEPNGIANNAAGLVAVQGYVPKINLSGSASLGDLFKTHTVAGQAVRHAAPVVTGDFGEVLGTGTTPAAVLWARTAGSGSGDVVGPGSATDGNLVVFDGTTGKLVKDGGAAGGAPTTAEYVTTAANGGLSAEVAIPGLAGSADIAGAAGAGTSYEFDSSDLTAWTWSPGAPAVSDADTTIKSHWYIKTTANSEYFALASWAPAGAFDLRAKFSTGADQAGQYYTVALIVTDSGNANRIMNDFGGTTADPAVMNARGFSYASASYTGRTNVNSTYTNEVYIRITRDGSNNFNYYWSHDGLTWVMMGTFNFSLTIAKMGLRIQSGSATAHYIAVDWIRADV